MGREPPPTLPAHTVDASHLLPSFPSGGSCLAVGDLGNWVFIFHPDHFLQFLLGRKEEEAVLVGGEWSPSLDGLDPKADPQVLVRTAIRCAQAQTGIDLSACTKW